MQQLKFKNLVKLFETLTQKYTLKEVLEMPVYLGDDDEFNGVHCAWYCEEVSKEDEDIVDMINNVAGNNKLKDKAILIS